MPLALRKKKTTNVMQIHQDNEAVKAGMRFTRSKRRSSGSPAKHPSKKRAFGDITNAIVARKDSLAKKVNIVRASTKKATTSTVKPEDKTTTLSTILTVTAPSKQQTTTSKVVAPQVMEDVTVDGDILEDSLEITLSQGSSLSSLQPEEAESSSSGSSGASSTQSSQSSVSSEVEALNEKNRLISSETEIKDAVAAISLTEEADFVDIDEENKDDPNQSPQYAQDIFLYLKQKEEACQVTCYFDRQPEVTRHMRAVLVDWMVEVQENFELNHETLYLAVKLVDHYLMVKTVPRDILQLLGASGLFIACKFDERCPPALDDFIYICDDAYDRQQFIDMEMELLRQVDFNLGLPLSYRFLRRYAKCCHASMESLTLARFILEQSLMHSQFMEIRDSLLASAALLLAFKMMKKGEWDCTLEHYSGYKEPELLECMKQLNTMLSAPPNKSLSTIKNKYSHKVFYEVATISPLDVLEDETMAEDK